MGTDATRRDPVWKVLAERELARRHLLDFTTLTYPRYRVGKFHRELAEVLTRFAKGEINRLIVTAPPRAGKSRLVSCQLPAFLFGMYPDAHIIAASHTHSLAASVSREVKRIMGSPEYQVLFPHVKLVERGGDGTNTADEWNIHGTGGTYKAAGVRAALSGRGMNWGLVDDPFRNREEADSKTIRDKVWEWWSSDFYTRAEGVAGVVVMHTRWSTDDLVGRLLDEGGWEIVNFPAIDDAGNSFWPEKFPVTTLDDIRNRIGPRNWASLYMQQPAPEEGAIFQHQWFRHYRREGENLVTKDSVRHNPHTWRRFATMDVAVTGKTSGDWTVLAVWAQAPGGALFLMHLDRVRLETPRLFPLIADARSRHGASVVYVESNGVGLPVFQMAEAQKLPVRAVDQHKDKVARAEAATPWFARGDVVFPADAPWLSTLESELLEFPHGTWDDQVDALSLAVQVADQRPLVVPSAVFATSQASQRINVYDLMTYPCNTSKPKRRMTGKGWATTSGGDRRRRFEW